MSRVDLSGGITVMSALFLAGMCYLLGVTQGGNSARDEFHSQAIEAGVAHWTINPTTGEKKFEYIRPQGTQ